MIDLSAWPEDLAFYFRERVKMFFERHSWYYNYEGEPTLEEKIYAEIVGDGFILPPFGSSLTEKLRADHRRNIYHAIHGVLDLHGNGK